ncbi:hypothetical protein SAMN05661096_01221 [Marivirga sericea]|uniref:GyrI-like small molecule binding domain-containing protein n=1 Tax=Marivirga sericea TaxID=1028 RepID=A0A1X7J366_9BACT|nr:hypothetical protein [Marivirga sericea]SMG21704.1 hypothetical protein SAMN05661096_01221 [Marivirga sericea]
MKKALLILIPIIVLSLIIYAILGGFKSIEKSVEMNPLIHIAGTNYLGKVGSDSLQTLFMQSKDLVESEETASSIAIVYYGEAHQKTGAVQNFIGVIVGDEPIHQMPKNWEIKTFKRSSSIRGCIEANVLAMPTPEDMLEELKLYAENQNITTDSIFIELYPGPNQLCVELLGMQ